MKGYIKKILLLSIIIFASIQLNAQGPPNPPGDPGGGGNNVVGGGAPIGSGIAILLSLGAAYGGRKVYKYWKDKEELEA